MNPITEATSWPPTVTGYHPRGLPDLRYEIRQRMNRVLDQLSQILHNWSFHNSRVVSEDVWRATAEMGHIWEVAERNSYGGYGLLDFPMVLLQKLNDACQNLLRENMVREHNYKEILEFHMKHLDRELVEFHMDHMDQMDRKLVDRQMVQLDQSARWWHNVRQPRPGCELCEDPIPASLGQNYTSSEYRPSRRPFAEQNRRGPAQGTDFQLYSPPPNVPRTPRLTQVLPVVAQVAPVANWIDDGIFGPFEEED